MAVVGTTLTTLLDGLAAARRSTGACPADVTGIDLWPSKGRVVHARDGGGFRARVQERSDGPWVSSTSRAGHRSLDDRGRCAFAAPARGVLGEDDRVGGCRRVSWQEGGTCDLGPAER